MSKIAKIYTKAIRRNMKPLFANWEPGRPLELGDFGIIADNTFVYIGNIKDEGMTFDVRKDETKDRKSFSSEGSTEIQLYAKGSTTVHGAVNAKAALEIAFTSEDAVFFNAAECTYDMIRNKAALGREIMKRKKDGSWKRKWVIVTDIVKAGSTTILVSGGKSSSVSLEAKGDVEKIDLADASLGLSVKRVRNVGYEVIAEEGMTPLLGLSGIRRRFPFIRSRFKSYNVELYSSGMIDAMNVSEDIETEGDADDLYFGQITYEDE